MKKMVSTNSWEYFASFFGVIFLSFGLGVLFSKSFQSYAILITVVGLIVHGIGMYKMYK